MATNRKRRNRVRQAVDGLPDDAYQFFSDGPFFRGETFERKTTEEERKAIWLRHRETIIARYREECRPGTDPRTWGEVLEDMKGAPIGNK